MPVTDRRYSSSVAFIAGQSGDGGPDWERVATAADTLVVLMGLGSIATMVDRLVAGGRSPSTPTAVIENGTLPAQRVVVADLAEIAEVCRSAEIMSPAIIVIGDVVKLRSKIAWFETSSHGVEPAPRLAV
ncbi:MAG TPA: SAM-dependent methyltransferase [Actinomycetota bacterium]|nr:SAM-dependent methyltransferase [Actinomycetota bacterium]